MISSICIMIVVTVFILVVSFMVSVIIREIIEVFYNTNNYVILITIIPVFTIFMLIFIPKLWIYLF